MKNAATTRPVRLGDRLIAAGLIDSEQCEKALAYQKEKGLMLGAALVELGFLRQEQLDEFFLSAQHSWSGERMIQSGLLNREQLAEALSFQAEAGGRLGNAVVALGYASQEQVESFFRQSGAQPSKRLGERLLEAGFLAEEQLEQALNFQKASGGQLGEILLSLELVTPEQLYRVLATQQSLGRVGKKLNFTDARKLPYEVALKYNALIINTRKDVYVLAVHRPLDAKGIKDVESYLDKPIEQVQATMGEIESFWEIIYQYEESQDSLYKLYNEQPANSAIVTLSTGQKIVGVVILLTMLLFLIVDHMSTLLIINIVLQVIYFVFTILKLIILTRGFRRREHLKYSKEQIDAIDERDLPAYTLLIPVYKEAGIISQLIKRLDAIDYPKHKLDIRILLEEDDEETIAVLNKMKLPSYYTLLVVPDTQPHTKPKACNYGLIRARGDYVVIYDAEDIPDPDQLKKVYLAFKELPDSYVCIQSKLNYFNGQQNLLTRWFTQEYSTWFDMLLIGVMTIDTPIPLGGTSNHFKADFLREIGAWDPFNVTEDADLGVRLYKKNYHTAVLDSHTWEEANSKPKNWVRQRSRWIKGYMQTWLVHMRNPLRLLKELGLKGFIGYQGMILGTPLLPLLNPIFWTLMIIWLVFEPMFMMQLFPGMLYYIASFQFILGNFLFVYTNILGTYTVVRDSEVAGEMHISYGIILSGIILPAYWVMMSIAAYKALFQLVRKPYYWEKTEHGLTEQTELETVSAENDVSGGQT